MTIGERIKSMRMRIGLSQVDFAQRIEVSKQTLYKYENNLVENIPSDKIEIIATMLGVTPAYLMGWQDRENKEIAHRFNEQCKVKGLSLKDVAKKAQLDLQFVKDVSIGIAPTNNFVDMDALACSVGLSYFNLMGWVTTEEEELQEAIQLAAASDNAEESLSFLGADYLEVYKLYTSLNDIGKRKALDNLRDLSQIYSNASTQNNVVELLNKDKEDRDYLFVQAAHHDTIEESDELEKTKRDLASLQRPNK